jgi:hypothetical protein
VDGTDWEARISAAWESFDKLSETDFLALIERLAAERPLDSGVGFFEPASSLDCTGHPDMAMPLAPHLARYQRSVATYARPLVEQETDS